MSFWFRNLDKLKFVMAETYVNDHANPSLKEDKQGNGAQQETMLPPFINTEPDRKREDRVVQVLQIIKSIRFTWIKSPAEVLQNEFQSVGLDGTVLDEDPILIFTLKRRLFGKFRRKLRRYKPLLNLINQKYWRWQIEMIWEVLFNRTIQKDSYVLTEILINLQ